MPAFESVSLRTAKSPSEQPLQADYFPQLEFFVFVHLP